LLRTRIEAVINKKFTKS